MSGYRVPRMDERESRAWLALIGTSSLLPAALDAQLQTESHLTHFEFLVLTALKQSRGNVLQMKQLAGATTATLPRLSKVISRMADRGLVERSPSAADGRAIDVTLTASGRSALVRAMPSHIATVRELVIDRLSPAQLDALADALEPVVRTLDPQQRFGPAADRDQP